MNYQLELERMLDKLGAVKPRLLLHACCAPCASWPLEYLHDHFDITIYYYNPNIMPRAEYDKRRNEFQKLERFPFHFVEGDWDQARYLEAVRGHEADREGGSRCALCFRLRLEQAAAYAAQGSFDWVATTLTVSPHKNAEVINTIGAELGAAAGVPWLYTDFKKRNGYLRSIALCRELGIYRQDYCGCRL